jgi:class 3 adenylate cyclase/tetratricopeptide (TPR) repeat protein
VDFVAVMDQVIALLRQRGRVTYSTLKRQFQLDEAALEDVKNELIEGQRLAVDERGNVLVWTGDTRTAPPMTSTPIEAPIRAPLTYTPPYLAEKILTSKSALEGERKQVTVLFADLKGSMELLADRDPEDARQLLDPVLERLMDAVHRYEGTVNQVMGDGIMALFGAPLAHEDHAVRACYAALAMQEAICRYSAEVRRTHGVEVQIRVGLHSGEVVVRAIGNDLHMDYSAIGQTTHLAARMEQLATPGSTRLTAATLRLAEGFVQVTALGPVPVKGLLEPVDVFELVGAGPARTRLQAASVRGLTRFVGRDAELVALSQALEQAGAGYGQVVALVGEPGVGKSRLVYEGTRSHRTQGWLVLESSSVSYGKATPYFPVVDLLKAYCGIEAHDDARRRREKALGKVLSLDEALRPMLPAILALFEVPVDEPQWQALDPPQRRQRTLDAVQRLLLRESQVQPVLVVCEDLHWIDAETQALLDGLVESLPTARLLLLVNYRPEYQHGWGSKTYYTQLRLDPLPPARADELLQALLGTDPSLAPLAPLLIARTEGNPFFLEESVRTMVETGGLVGTPGAYRLTQDVATLRMPATVQAVLAARIDRLSPEDKHLLQSAAVIGKDVPAALLQAMAEVPEATLYQSLSRLQAAEFLYETRLFPELEYTFTHALTHEVAYGSLLLERRRALHARIVDALEALAGERMTEQIDRLAHHALRGAVWDKAVTYCHHAGTRAWDRAAFRETVTAFEQALQALGHLPEPGDTRGQGIELRLGLGNALQTLGEYGRSLAQLGEAEVLARARNDRARLGLVLARMAFVRRITGDAGGAITAGQQTLALAAELGENALQAQASHILGQAYQDLGDLGRAAALLRQTIEAVARESSTPSIDLRILSQARLATILGALGAFAEGRGQGEEALRLATREGRGTTPIVAHGCLGELYLAHGDLEPAIHVYAQGLTLCRASGNRTWLRPIAAGLGYASALGGHLAEGRALLEEAISEDIHTGGLQGYASRVAWFSEVCRLAGRHEEAGQHAREALDLAWQQKARGDEALALHQLGVVQAHADSPNTEQAETHYRQALALAEELGMRPLQAHCHRSLGTLYGKTGQREQARTALSTAIEMYTSMDMTFWLPQTEAALVQVEAR